MQAAAIFVGAAKSGSRKAGKRRHLQDPEEQVSFVYKIVVLWTLCYISLGMFGNSGFTYDRVQFTVLSISRGRRDSEELQCVWSSCEIR